MLKYDQHYPRIVEVNIGQELLDIFLTNANYDETKIRFTVNMGNNLRKSNSKYESHPSMFATAKPDLVVAGWRRYKKKIRKKPWPKTEASYPTDGMPNDKLSMVKSNLCTLRLIPEAQTLVRFTLGSVVFEIQVCRKKGKIENVLYHLRITLNI